MKMTSAGYRMVALFLSLILPWSGTVSYAGMPSQSSSAFVKIPKNLGTLEVSVKGLSDKTIVYIQDAHDSLEAQQSIASGIRFLTGRFGVRTVFEEGYEGPVPTARFFGFMKQEPLRRKVADFLLDKLRIGGAEYAHINRIRSFRLIGADDLKKYRDNITAYREAVRHQAAAEKDLKAALGEIEILGNRYYPKSFKDWLRRQDRFEEGQVPLLDYLKEAVLAAGGGASLADYPSIGQLLRADRSGGENAMALAAAVDARSLFSEIEALENRIARKFMREKRDLEVFGWREALRLLLRMNRMEVSSAEYEASRALIGAFDARALAVLIARETGKSAVLSRLWESNLRKAAVFYETALARDAAIEKALTAFVNDPQEKTAVLVYGGFHKDNIQAILKKLGVSYQIVMPKMSGPDPLHEGYYRKLMAAGHHDYEKTFFASPLAAKATRPPSSFVESFGETSVHRLYQTALRNPDASPALLGRLLTPRPEMRSLSVIGRLREFLKWRMFGALEPSLRQAVDLLNNSDPSVQEEGLRAIAVLRTYDRVLDLAAEDLSADLPVPLRRSQGAGEAAARQADEIDRQLRGSVKVLNDVFDLVRSEMRPDLFLDEEIARIEKRAGYLRQLYPLLSEESRKTLLFPSLLAAFLLIKPAYLRIHNEQKQEPDPIPLFQEIQARAPELSKKLGLAVTQSEVFDPTYVISEIFAHMQFLADHDVLRFPEDEAALNLIGELYDQARYPEFNDLTSNFVEMLFLRTEKQEAAGHALKGILMGYPEDDIAALIGDQPRVQLQGNFRDIALIAAGENPAQVSEAAVRYLERLDAALHFAYAQLHDQPGFAQLAHTLGLYSTMGEPRAELRQAGRPFALANVELDGSEVDGMLEVYQDIRESLVGAGYETPPEFDDDQTFMAEIERLQEWSYAIPGSDHRIAGFVLNDAEPSAGDRFLEVELIGVDPVEQGHGYGHRLLAASEMLARKLGKEALWLEVERDNEEAIRLYRSYGFRREAKRGNASYLVMYKRIRPFKAVRNEERRAQTKFDASFSAPSDDRPRPLRMPGQPLFSRKKRSELRAKPLAEQDIRDFVLRFPLAENHVHFGSSVPFEILWRLALERMELDWTEISRQLSHVFGEAVDIRGLLLRARDAIERSEGDVVGALREKFRQWNQLRATDQADLKKFTAVNLPGRALYKGPYELQARLAREIALGHYRNGVRVLMQRASLPVAETGEELKVRLLEKTRAIQEGFRQAEQETLPPPEGIGLEARLVYTAEKFLPLEKITAQVKALLEILEQYPDLRETVAGFDAADKESEKSPAEFRAVFEMIHAYNQRRRAAGEPVLGLTYHVGEDFKHATMESGIRHVHEALELGVNGIGHGLVLGINPRRFWGKTKTEHVSERMAQIYYDLRNLKFDRPALDAVGLDAKTLDSPGLWKELRRYGRDFEVIRRQIIPGIQLILGEKQLDRARESELYNLIYGLKEIDPAYFVARSYSRKSLPTLLRRQRYVLNKVIEADAAIEVSPTINVLIGPIKKYEEHPVIHFLNYTYSGSLPQFMGQSPAVTINTDNPQIMGVSLADEYVYIGRAFRLSYKQLKRLVLTGIRYRVGQSPLKYQKQIMALLGPEAEKPGLIRQELRASEDLSHGWIYPLLRQARIRSDNFMFTRDGLYVPTPDHLWREVLAAFPPVSGAPFRVFAAGSGQGIFEVQLAHERPNARIFGVESDIQLHAESQRLSALAQAQSRIAEGQVRFEQGDFNDPKFSEPLSGADFVYYYEGGTKHPETLIETLAGSMKPGARVVVLGSRLDDSDFVKNLMASGRFVLENDGRPVRVLRRTELRTVDIEEITAVLKAQELEALSARGLETLLIPLKAAIANQPLVSDKGTFYLMAVLLSAVDPVLSSWTLLRILTARHRKLMKIDRLVHEAAQGNQEKRLRARTGLLKVLLESLGDRRNPRIQSVAGETLKVLAARLQGLDWLIHDVVRQEVLMPGEQPRAPGLAFHPHLFGGREDVQGAMPKDYYEQLYGIGARKEPLKTDTARTELRSGSFEGADAAAIRRKALEVPALGGYPGLGRVLDLDVLLAALPSDSERTALHRMMYEVDQAAFEFDYDFDLLPLKSDPVNLGLLFVEESGAVSGHVRISLEEAVPKVEDLATLKKKDQKPGRGQLLMNHALRMLRERGFNRLQLYPTEKALPFYADYFSQRAIWFGRPRPADEPLRFAADFTGASDEDLKKVTLGRSPVTASLPELLRPEMRMTLSAVREFLDKRPHAVWYASYDRQGHESVEYVNPAFAKVYGTTAEDILRKKTYRAINGPEAPVEKFRADDAAAMKQGIFMGREGHPRVTVVKIRFQDGVLGMFLPAASKGPAALATLEPELRETLKKFHYEAGTYLTLREKRLIRKSHENGMLRRDGTDGSMAVWLFGEPEAAAPFFADRPESTGAPEIPQEYFRNKKVLVVPGYGNLPFMLRSFGAREVVAMDVDPVTIAWQKLKWKTGLAQSLQWLFVYESARYLVRATFQQQWFAGLNQPPAEDVLDRLSFRTGSVLDKSAYREEKFDLIVVPYLFGFAHGLEGEAAWDKALENMRAALSPGGHIVLMPGRVNLAKLPAGPEKTVTENYHRWLEGLAAKNWDVNQSAPYHFYHFLGSSPVWAGYSVLTPRSEMRFGDVLLPAVPRGIPSLLNWVHQDSAGRNPYLVRLVYAASESVGKNAGHKVLYHVFAVPLYEAPFMQDQEGRNVDYRTDYRGTVILNFDAAHALSRPPENGDVSVWPLREEASWLERFIRGQLQGTGKILATAPIRTLQEVLRADISLQSQNLEALSAGQMRAIFLEGFQSGRLKAASGFEAWRDLQTTEKKFRVAGNLILHKVEGKWGLLLGQRDKNPEKPFPGFFTVPVGKQDSEYDRYQRLMDSHYKPADYHLQSFSVIPTYARGDAIELAHEAGIRETGEETAILLRTKDLIGRIDDFTGFNGRALIQLFIALFPEDQPLEIEETRELFNYQWIPLDLILGSPEGQVGERIEAYLKTKLQEEVHLIPELRNQGLESFRRMTLNALAPWDVKRGELRTVKPRVVLFDVDGVLVPNLDAKTIYARIAKDLETRFQVKIGDPARLRSEVFYLGKSEAERAVFFNGDLTEEEYMKGVNQRLRDLFGISHVFTLSEWADLIFRDRRDQMQAPVTDEIRAQIGALRQDLKVQHFGVLSDRLTGDWPFFNKILEDYYPGNFSDRALHFVSYVMKAAKSDPQGTLFLRALEQMQRSERFRDLRPEEILFVDDKEDNLAKARALGFQTAHFIYGKQSLRSALTPYFEAAEEARAGLRKWLQKAPVLFHRPGVGTVVELPAEGHGFDSEEVRDRAIASELAQRLAAIHRSAFGGLLPQEGKPGQWLEYLSNPDYRILVQIDETGTIEGMLLSDHEALVSRGTVTIRETAVEFDEQLKRKGSLLRDVFLKQVYEEAKAQSVGWLSNFGTIAFHKRYLRNRNIPYYFDDWTRFEIQVKDLESFVKSDRFKLAESKAELRAEESGQTEVETYELFHPRQRGQKLARVTLFRGAAGVIQEAYVTFPERKVETRVKGRAVHAQEVRWIKLDLDKRTAVNAVRLKNSRGETIETREFPHKDLTPEYFAEIQDFVGSISGKIRELEAAEERVPQTSIEALHHIRRLVGNVFRAIPAPESVSVTLGPHREIKLRIIHDESEGVLRVAFPFEENKTQRDPHQFLITIDPRANPPVSMSMNVRQTDEAGDMVDVLEIRPDIREPLHPDTAFSFEDPEAEEDKDYELTMSDIQMALQDWYEGLDEDAKDPHLRALIYETLESVFQEEEAAKPSRKLSALAKHFEPAFDLMKRAGHKEALTRELRIFGSRARALSARAPKKFGWLEDLSTVAFLLSIRLEGEAFDFSSRHPEILDETVGFMEQFDEIFTEVVKDKALLARLARDPKEDYPLILKLAATLKKLRPELRASDDGAAEDKKFESDVEMFARRVRAEAIRSLGHNPYDEVAMGECLLCAMAAPLVTLLASEYFRHDPEVSVEIWGGQIRELDASYKPNPAMFMHFWTEIVRGGKRYYVSLMDGQMKVREWAVSPNVQDVSSPESSEKYKFLESHGWKIPVSGAGRMDPARLYRLLEVFMESGTEEPPEKAPGGVETFIREAAAGLIKAGIFHSEMRGEIDDGLLTQWIAQNHVGDLERWIRDPEAEAAERQERIRRYLLRAGLILHHGAVLGAIQSVTRRPVEREIYELNEQRISRLEAIVSKKSGDIPGVIYFNEEGVFRNFSAPLAARSETFSGLAVRFLGVEGLRVMNEALPADNDAWWAALGTFEDPEALRLSILNGLIPKMREINRQKFFVPDEVSRPELRIQAAARQSIEAMTVPAAVFLDARQLISLTAGQSDRQWDEILALIRMHRGFDVYIDHADRSSLAGVRLPKLQRLLAEYPDRVHAGLHDRANLGKKKILIQASFLKGGGTAEQTRKELDDLRKRYRLTRPVYALEYGEAGALRAFVGIAESMKGAELIRGIGEAFAVLGPNGRWRITESYLASVTAEMQGRYAIAWSA